MFGLLSPVIEMPPQKNVGLLLGPGMRLLTKIRIWRLLLLVATILGPTASPTFSAIGWSAGAHPGSAAGTAIQGHAQLEDFSPAGTEEKDHGLSQKAVEIGRIYGFPITNSMIVSWIVALGLILLAQFLDQPLKDSSRVRPAAGRLEGSSAARVLRLSTDGYDAQLGELAV